MPNSAFWTRISTLYGSQTSSVVLSTHNCELNTRIKRVYLFQPSPVAFAYKSLWIPDITCGFCMQNGDFWTRITSLYWSQTWPVFLCMYNSVISTRITRLYGFQPSSVVLWIKNSDLMTTIACVYGSQTSPSIFACKTAWLASELLVSMGPSPRVCFLHAKQRLLDQNNKSLRVPDKTCRFVQGKQHL